MHHKTYGVRNPVHVDLGIRPLHRIIIVVLESENPHRRGVVVVEGQNLEPHRRRAREQEKKKQEHDERTHAAATSAALPALCGFHGNNVI